jgi:hypothetical protein
VNSAKVEGLLGHVWLQGRLKCVYAEPDKKTGEAIGYYENGSLRFRYPMSDGTLHGMGKTWYEDGTIQGEEQYFKGTLYGVSRQYYPNGQVSLETTYAKGIYHGPKREWYNTGALKSLKPYIHDRLHGTWSEWYCNGGLKMQIEFLNGLKNGFSKKWSPDGKLVLKTIYVRDTKISGSLYNLIQNKELTAQDILRIQNAAVRRICLTELGYGRFLSQVEHKVIDKEGEYELVRVNWHKKEEPIALVKVRCPSTNAFYTLRVPPSISNVKQAVAWTFHMDKDQYNPIKEA